MYDELCVHLGIAERGKMHALEGEYTLALTYYREAMRMTIAAGDPEILFRHYLTCSIECLEQMGCYDEVLSYCDRLVAFCASKPDLDSLTRRELAGTYERRGVVLLKMGRPSEARNALSDAITASEKEGQHLPLAETLFDWLRRGLHVDGRRVEVEQARHCYFSVRPETVEPSRALDLDPRLLGGMPPL